MCVLLSMVRPQHAAVHVQIQECHTVRRESIAEDARERMSKRRLSPLLHSILFFFQKFLHQSKRKGYLRIKRRSIASDPRTNTISRKVISCVVNKHL